MSDVEFSDETLMAFADGELDPATASLIAERRKADTALSTRIRVFEETASLARRSLDGIVREPVPIRLLAATRPAKAEGGSVGWRRLSTSRPLQAIAASLVLAVGLGAGYLAGHQPGSDTAGRIAGLAICGGGALSQSLETAVSGERRQDGACTIMPVASYRAADGAVCREFQAVGTGSDRTAVAGIACRNDHGDWRPRIAVDMTPGASPEGAYRPASGPQAGPDLATLRTAAGIAAEPLSAADEERLRRNAWRPAP